MKVVSYRRPDAEVLPANGDTTAELQPQFEKLEQAGLTHESRLRQQDAWLADARRYYPELTGWQLRLAHDRMQHVGDLKDHASKNLPQQAVDWLADARQLACFSRSVVLTFRDQWTVLGLVKDRYGKQHAFQIVDWTLGDKLLTIEEIRQATRGRLTPSQWAWVVGICIVAAVCVGTSGWLGLLVIFLPLLLVAVLVIVGLGLVSIPSRFRLDSPEF